MTLELNNQRHFRVIYSLKSKSLNWHDCHRQKFRWNGYIEWVLKDSSVFTAFCFGTLNGNVTFHCQFQPRNCNNLLKQNIWVVWAEKYYTFPPCLGWHVWTFSVLSPIATMLLPKCPSEPWSKYKMLLFC